ncbi:MAG: hypothetical protein FJ191_06905 [Gammaproteobacteria bacterium]|nr:hypothetical protein [Gammaproteobacteria bacterium]
MPLIRAVQLCQEAERNPPPDLSPARARLRGAALALLEREELAQPAYCFRLVPLDAPAGSPLRAGGEELLADRLLPDSGELTGLACGACTLGPALEARIRGLFGDRQAALAVALDEVANELVLALGRRLFDRMLMEARRRGLTMAGELRAGDPGLELAAQPAVLRLAEAARIGVALHGGQLLKPIKSVTMVCGIGRDLPASHWSRCDECPSAPRCRLRARTAGASVAAL